MCTSRTQTKPPPPSPPAEPSGLVSVVFFLSPFKFFFSFFFPPLPSLGGGNPFKVYQWFQPPAAASFPWRSCFWILSVFPSSLLVCGRIGNSFGALTVGSTRAFKVQRLQGLPQLRFRKVSTQSKLAKQTFQNIAKLRKIGVTVRIIAVVAGNQTSIRFREATGLLELN